MEILISSGFGAGWSTWAYPDEVARFALTYRPIIDYIKEGGKFVEKSYVWNGAIDISERWEEPGASILQQFQDDLNEKFGDDTYFYFGGARGLMVLDVDGQFKVNEYDGHESLDTPGADDWYDSSDWG